MQMIVWKASREMKLSSLKDIYSGYAWYKLKYLNSTT